MNGKLARALVRMYPRAWRRRYGAEFEALLEEGPGGLGTVIDVMGSALGERVFPAVGGEMTVGGSRLEYWSVRAPWAVFVIAPLAVFAASYSFALFILWSGWRIFLPNEKMPFVAVDGWAVAYFSVGRVLYFCAPIVLGLAIAWMAARPGIKAIWPSVGLILLAMIGGTAQVRVSRASLDEPGHVGMQLVFGHTSYTAAVLAVSILLYLWLRTRRGRVESA